MDLPATLRAYHESTQLLLREAALVTDEQLDRRVGDEWSPRQILHHVADSEAHSYIRLRRLLAEPAGSIIHGYDEAAWAECPALGYTDLPVTHSRAVFRSVRAASLDLLGRIGPADLERYGTHTESGRYTLADWLDIYTRHPLQHARQLHQALRA